jgi:hypothetical protein
MTTIVPPGSIETFVFGIDDNGVITGSYISDEAHGFIRAKDGTYKTFDPKKSVDTNPLAINAKGAITGWYQTENPGPIHGFLRTP